MQTVAARRVGEVDFTGLLHLDVREGALTPSTMTKVNLSTPQPLHSQPLNPKDKVIVADFQFDDSGLRRVWTVAAR